MPRRKSTRRPRRVNRKRVARKGARGSKRTVRRSDAAVIIESVENQLTLDTNGNYAYNYTTSLSEYQRAQEVAHAYKYYRCAKVELTFVPYANVSAVGGGGAATRLPQMYFTVDRVANMWIQPTEDEMQSRGISPFIFNKKRVFSWRPSLLQNIQMETNQPADGTGQPLGINLISAINSVPLYNKWLPTQQSFGFKSDIHAGETQTGTEMVQPAVNPYALRYYGASFVIDQENGTTAAVGDLISKVTWEFKGPRALVTNVPLKQNNVSQATSSTTGGVVPNTQPTTYP